MKSPHRVDPDAVALVRQLAEAVSDRRGQMSLRAVSIGSGVHHSSVDRVVRGGRAPGLDTFVGLARWAGLRVVLMPADLTAVRLAGEVRRLRAENHDLRRRLAVRDTETERTA